MSGGDTYTLGPVDRAPLGGRRVIIHTIITGCTVVVGRRVAAWLGSCRFEPIARHSVRCFVDWANEERRSRGLFSLLTRLWAGAVSAARAEADARHGVEFSRRGVEGRLDGLARDGFLISRRQVEQQLGETREQDCPHAIAAVVVSTANGSAALARCLESCTANQRGAGRKTPLLVLDDSAKPAAVDGSRQVADEAAARSGFRVDFVGRAERERWSERLAKITGVDRALVRFALLGDPVLGPTPGANRNAGLLAMAGRMFLSLDDDTLCAPLSFQEGPARSAIDAKADPRSHVWEDGARAEGASRGEDLLGLHESLLGATLTQAVGRCGGASHVDLRTADDVAMRDIWLRRGRVVVTTTGVAWRDKGASPTRIAAVRCPTLSYTFCPGSTSYALDDRSLVPPFLPLLRREGAVFASLLRPCLPDAYSAHLPWALPREPLDPEGLPAGYECGDERQDLACVLNDFAGMVDADSVQREPAARLKAIGLQLEDIAGMGVVGLAQLTRRLFLDRSAGRIRRLEQVLASCRRPFRGLAADCEGRLAKMRSTLLEEDAALPSDVCHDRDRGAAWDLVRHITNRFGQLLQAWPALVEGARRRGSME